MNEIVSYVDLRAELGSEATTDDTLLKEKAELATRLLESMTDRVFYPTLAQEDLDFDESYWLWLNGFDLLELTSLATNNGGTAIATANVMPMRGRSYSRTPYTKLAIDRSTTSYFTYTDTPQKANEVTGYWGYHSDWANAWELTGDTVQDVGGINASVTSITVSDADGTSPRGRSPRLKGQQLITIDDEHIYVVSEASDVLTVVRGVNGTTAASHDNADAISAFIPDFVAYSTALRLASFLYKQKDSQVFSTTAYPELGVVEIPPGLPVDVKDRIKLLRREEL